MQKIYDVMYIDSLDNAVKVEVKSRGTTLPVLVIDIEHVLGTANTNILYIKRNLEKEATENGQEGS